jgi:hypothetical protein
MNKYIKSEVTQHIMKLLQLGANVQVVDGKMVYVKYLITPTFEVSYVYHVNKHKKYFLERIKPYPLPIKEFDTVNDVIDIIKIDIEQYTNAINCSKTKKVIEINSKLHQSIKCFEDLFLYYNIEDETIDKIEKSLDEINNQIKEASKKSKRVYFKKEPDNL